MIICCDASGLFSLYHYDSYSMVARKQVTSHACSSSLSPFNYFELQQVFRFSEFCKIIKKRSATLLSGAFEKDLATAYLEEQTCNLATILAEAHLLSSLYTLQKGSCSFDIIHVAPALYLEVEVFLTFTFDKNQRSLARSQGLKTLL